jgi:hypothetical protein
VPQQATASPPKLSPDLGRHATAHAALHTLAKHLEEVNALLETSFEQISELFLTISGKIATLKDIADESERARTCDEINALVMQSITDMQFQDRVSQNIVIARNVMNHAAEELQVTDDVPLNSERKEVMLHLLNLGDIRQKFLAYCIERGFVPKEEAMPEQRQQTDDDDDIELF